MHEQVRPPGVAVVFSGGGTGGHLYPALALADALRALRPDVRALFLGARRGVEARVLPERGEEHRLVPIRGVDRTGGIRGNLGVPRAVLSSLFTTFEYFRQVQPELVVVTGGYAGAPAGLAAAVMGIPLALQEQNAVPGVTTRILAGRARQIHLAYPEAADRLPARARGRVHLSGNPVAPPSPRDPAGARAAFKLDPTLPILLVVGGSQGSLALNRAVLEMVSGMERAPGFQLLWSTGPSHAEAIQAALGAMGPRGWVHVLGYIHDMPGALASAAAAVSRAGAMATSEFLAWGLPSILVPLPTAAADHQARNARALAEAGCALHLPQDQLDGAALRRAVEDLMGDEEGRASMARAARERGQPQAAREIAQALCDLLPPLAGGAV